jgi:hypothetical protein
MPSKREKRRTRTGATASNKVGEEVMLFFPTACFHTPKGTHLPFIVSKKWTKGILPCSNFCAKLPPKIIDRLLPLQVYFP